MKLHHIGILVDNYEKIKQEYIDNFGYSLVKEITRDGSIFCFLDQGNKLPYLEIIKLKNNSLNLPPIHLAYQVQGIQEKFDQLIKSGYIQIKKPSPASMITENAFLQPRWHNLHGACACIKYSLIIFNLIHPHEQKITTQCGSFGANSRQL